jgi:large exoprotein involved in heme utilization and adhesion
VAIWAALQAPHGAAQIVVDGTLGGAGPLTGPAFEIPDTLGTQVGGNLFHSFSDFNVRAGESATFTSAFMGPTANVIARVSGVQTRSSTARSRAPLPARICGSSIQMGSLSGPARP